MWLTEQLADLFVRRRWSIALLVVALTAIAVAGHLGSTFEKRIGESDAGIRNQSERDLLRELRGQFDMELIECLVVVDGDDLFTKENILALRDIREALRDLPQVSSIRWVDDIPSLNLFGLSEPLLPNRDAEPAEFRESREKVLSNPLAIGQLVSPDGTTAMMPVVYRWIEFREGHDLTGALVDEATRILALKHPQAKLRVRLTGRVPILQAIEHSFESNQLKFQIIGYGLVVAISLFLFRGWCAIVIVASAPLMGIFWSLGLLDFFQFQRNSLTSIVMPVLVMMVGMTDGIHMMLHIRRHQAAGLDRVQAVHDAIIRVGPACALTSLTTAIGFASLCLAQSEFIRNFGQGCMWAVIICFVSVISIIPLLCCTRLGQNLHLQHERDIVARGLHRLAVIIDFSIRHARAVSYAGIGLTISLALASLSLRPDASTRENLPSNSVAAQTLLHCDRAFGGIGFARVMIEWPRDMDPQSPEILAAVEQAESLITQEPLLRHPLSIRNFVVALAPSDANIDERMSLLDLVPPPLRRTVYNPAQHRTLITVRVRDLGVARYRPVFRRLENRLDELGEQLPGFRFELSGLPVVEGQEIFQIVYDLATSLGTAGVVIFLVMWLAYRSLRIGLIAVIPNVLPLAVTAMVLLLFGYPLSFTSVCAFVVCVGIAVDDTIHFLTRFLSECEAGKSTPAALKATFHAVGAALITTTLVLLTGFAAVQLSELPTHRMFSMMACYTVAAALVADLVILPAMLAWFYPSSRAGNTRENAANRPMETT